MKRTEEGLLISDFSLYNPFQFMIDDQIVCVSNDLQGDWKMYRMDSGMFLQQQRKRLPIFFYSRNIQRERIAREFSRKFLILGLMNI